MTSLPTIVVLFGGRSSEHEISCVTAAGVLSAVDPSAYRTIPVGVTQSGAFVLAEDQVSGFALDASNMPHVRDNGTRILWPESPGQRSLTVRHPDGSTESLGTIDLVFPLLHGPFGEDGTVQGMLELLDVPYLGSGVLASALCMDKHFTKTVLSAAGLPVAAWRRLDNPKQAREPGLLEELVSELGLPVFVKPARAGSSVGVTKVHDVVELPAALDAAFLVDSSVLVEQAIVGREIELAVLGGDSHPRVSDVAGEIVLSGREFYDYEAKYLGASGIELRCPTEVSDSELATLQDAAARAFTALGCEDLARVDFFLTEQQAIINEINTMPGFTPISMFPALWEASGMSYQSLISYLIDRALRRAQSSNE